jgi:flagellar biosynthesis protein FlhA
VTRIGEAGDLDKQVGNQLLAQPPTLFAAAGVMIILALVPGMPKLFTFFVFAAALGYAGYRLHTRVKAGRQRRRGRDRSGAARRPRARPRLGTAAGGAADLGGGRLQAGRHGRQGAGRAAHQAHQGHPPEPVGAMGVLLPAIGVRDDLALRPSQYSVSLSGVVVAEGEVHPEHLMAIPSPNVYGELDGIPGLEPAFGMAVTWIAPDQKGHALGLGYQVVEVPSVIATHCSKIIRDHLHELFRHEDVPALMERLNALSPKLSRRAGKGAEPHPAAARVPRAAGEKACR